jgi:hypothetical protein
MTIRKFEAVIHITSPTSCKTRLVANIDPNISFLPTSLLEFAMKHLAGVLLAKLQSASKKTVKNPVTNVHAVKMREEREFYQKWLMAKFQSVCAAKGWEMPKVAAFDLPDSYPQHSYHESGLSRSLVDNRNSPDDHATEGLSSSMSASMKETDSVSQLSGTTRKSWSGNPIATYLREMELKVQERKAEAVAALRKRAADILIPKEIPPEKNERLNKLRIAKARRAEQAARESPIVAEETVENTSIAQRLAFRLFSHGSRTRSAVVCTLVLTLFFMLHPEPLWRLSEFGPAPSRLELLIQDCLMVFYILLCAVPHFLLCDAALVYAFDALEFGSKTGRHVKTYYSDNVQTAVGVCSLGIVVTSIAQAVFKVWLRLLVWALSRSFDILVRATSPKQIQALFSMALQSAPLEMQGKLESAGLVLSGFMKYGFGSLTWLLLISIRLVRYVFLLSHPTGRFCHEVVAKVASSLVRYIEHAVDVTEGSEPQIAWRLDAFLTARWWLMNTSFFLVTVLVLFHATTTRPPNTVPQDEHGEVPVFASADTSGDSASRHEGNTRIRASPSPRPRLANSVSLQSIPESSSESAVENGMPIGNGKINGSIESDSASSSTRRRFRFREGKPALSTATARLNVSSNQRIKRGRDPHLLPQSKSM